MHVIAQPHDNRHILRRRHLIGCQAGEAQVVHPDFLQFADVIRRRYKRQHEWPAFVGLPVGTGDHPAGGTRSQMFHVFHHAMMPGEAFSKGISQELFGALHQVLPLQHAGDQQGAKRRSGFQSDLHLLHICL